LARGIITLTKHGQDIVMGRQADAPPPPEGMAYERAIAGFGSIPMPKKSQGRRLRGVREYANLPRPGGRGRVVGRMTATHSTFWRERLTVPAYRVTEAARYAHTSKQTISNWQRIHGNRAGVISKRDEREGLSYLQLIELGVVAAMRNSGVKLERIREAREYLRSEFESEFPFAHYRFKTDGKTLFMHYDQLVQTDKDKLLALNENGQLAWNEILSGLLHEFEYDTDIGTVLRWRVGGYDSPVRLDPRIAFGAPHVSGTATWVLRERWKSGEGLADIAEDYNLATTLVVAALEFEQVDLDHDRPNKWIH